ncbi:MAG: hypothetical protein DRH70_04900 [Candidatus Coatesbacteria bacterium]|nr:MAG: hypothetical protein DRH70_04900 [Candidatus Coatesbacteria bacterium]
MAECKTGERRTGFLACPLETMDRKTRRRMRLMRLCEKYGYEEMASVLKRRIERSREAQSAQGTPLLRNLRGGVSGQP